MEENTIIDRNTFLAVQELKNKRAEILRERRPSGNPLLKMVFCGICGALHTQKVCNGKTYWVCRCHDRDKNACPSPRIPQDEIHSAFLRVYHKLRLHGEPILKQLTSDLQSIRERRMLWSMNIIELNKRISDISDQERMLADMNKCGLVDPDIFIFQTNELSHQLRAAKQEKERILGSENDDTIPRTRELLETLETLPEFLTDFDGEIFAELIDHITADAGNTLRFHLKNGLELTEHYERSAR